MKLTIYGNPVTKKKQPAHPVQVHKVRQKDPIHSP